MSKNTSDAIDQEIDEMLKSAKSGKFKSGIYNFCDRWCEKCKDAEKCFLRAQETRRKICKVSGGKDDNNWFEDVRRNFEITRRLIERGLREDGLDPQEILKEKPEKCWDDDAHERYDKIQCLIKAKKYMKNVLRFLDGFHQGRLACFGGLEMEISYEDVRDEIETIAWYYTIIPVKIWRALYEKEDCRREKDKELKKLTQKDLAKYRKLVLKCFNKSKKAWQGLAKKRRELRDETSGFIIALNEILNEFEDEYARAGIGLK